MQGPSLVHALVTAEGSAPRRWMLFLHGIFGSGANWRTFARKWTAARPSWGAVLVDLRMHGQSQGFAAPHTLAAAAEDVRALEAQIPGPLRGVVGHSFGGKVALAYVEARAGDLDHAWILDSSPGARPHARGSEDTLNVLEILESLPGTFASRDAFRDALTARGISPATRDWLAMNVVAHGDTYRLRLELPAIRALLESYFARDLWPVIESPPGDVALHLVIGGRSSVYGPADRARAQAAARAHPSRVDLHLLPDAGHWVHVDAPDALLAMITDATPA